MLVQPLHREIAAKQRAVQRVLQQLPVEQLWMKKAPKRPAVRYYTTSFRDFDFPSVLFFPFSSFPL